MVAGYSYDARHREDNDVIGREDDAVSIAALIGALAADDADDAALRLRAARPSSFSGVKTHSSS